MSSDIYISQSTTESSDTHGPHETDQQRPCHFRPKSKGQGHNAICINQNCAYFQTEGTYKLGRSVGHSKAQGHRSRLQGQHNAIHLCVISGLINTNESHVPSGARGLVTFDF